MQLTNRFNLPKTLVNAIERDPYSKGPARMSVTGLLRAPRITTLHHKYYHHIVTDVSEHIWTLMGRAVHRILEDGGDEEHITEERLFITVRGWVISGAVDVQRLSEQRVRIVDYKNTAAFALRNEKTEWVEQLNCYAHLLREAKGYEIHSLSVCAFVRDWNRHRVGEDDYPPAPCVMVSIPMWDRVKAAAFIEERVRLHQEAQSLRDLGQEPPLCTDQDRWMRPTKWEVWRTGNKRPTRSFLDADNAGAYLSSKGDEYEIKLKKGEPIRCTGNYCQVATWCKQFAQWEKENGNTEH